MLSRYDIENYCNIPVDCNPLSPISFPFSHLLSLLLIRITVGMLVFLGTPEHLKPFLSNSSQNGSQLPSSLFLV